MRRLSSEFSDFLVRRIDFQIKFNDVNEEITQIVKYQPEGNEKILSLLNESTESYSALEKTHAEFLVELETKKSQLVEYLLHNQEDFVSGLSVLVEGASSALALLNDPERDTDMQTETAQRYFDHVKEKKAKQRELNRDEVLL
ncbi:uncharacterized protein MONOS_18061 [Monocercomonoides exilis]|uniref:uncharacterized protein n=1 Tax=Monocercomonoides exilis TaxID=2049356 RepID=UPI0035599BFA|nr:hypothetical protein MONOS_18061 [Monocercomonoides exilis]